MNRHLHNLKVRLVRWALAGVPLTDLKTGTNTITHSPGGVDVLRWSTTQGAAQLGDLGMNVSTGHPQAFIAGSTRNLVGAHEALLADGSTPLSGDLDLGSNKAVNVGEPDAASDAATKNYVDTRIAPAVDVGTEGGPGYVGNATIAQVNALTPAEGDSVVATDAGTPTAGASDALAAGDVAEFDGTSWKQIVANSGGFPPSGTRALVATSSTFVSGGGLTASTDEGKIVRWDGTALLPAGTTTPQDGTIVVVRGEAAVSENTTLTFDGAVPTGTWSIAGSVGAGDHGGLTGLTDDDHSQYGLLAGRGAGQVLHGGQNSGGNLTLRSTSNATKGAVLIGTGDTVLPEGGDATGEIGGVGQRFLRIRAQEVISGDHIFERRDNDGSLIRWRVREYHDGLRAVNDVTGQEYDLVMRRRGLLRRLLGR